MWVKYAKLFTFEVCFVYKLLKFSCKCKKRHKLNVILVSNTKFQIEKCFLFGENSNIFCSRLPFSHILSLAKELQSSISVKDHNSKTACNYSTSSTAGFQLMQVEETFLPTDHLAALLPTLPLSHAFPAHFPCCSSARWVFHCCCYH